MTVKNQLVREEKKVIFATYNVWNEEQIVQVERFMQERREQCVCGGAWASVKAYARLRTQPAVGRPLRPETDNSTRKF